MKKAVIGTFYKDLKLAQKALNQFPRWVQKRKVVLKVQFPDKDGLPDKSGYLIIGKSQLPEL